MRRDEKFCTEIRRRMSGEIRFDEPAKRHVSIGVGGKIDVLLFPENREELAEVFAFLRERQVSFLPVGNWTNLIVRDGGYRGVLISLMRLRNQYLRDEGEAGKVLVAESGCLLSELVGRSVRESLAGMEFCGGIPGSVGGAVRMNAGAYGGEIKDIVETVSLLDASEKIHDVPAGELRFTYRNLDLPSETIIIGAAFRLMPGDKDKIAARVREVVEMRREKHPLAFPNAGSIFRNPRDRAAGRFIEEAGLKGARIGDAQISEKHGNFIVNRGHATAAEILSLIAMVQRSVFQSAGCVLETEVKIIGEP